MSKSNWLSKVLANLGTSNDANGNVEVDPASVEYVHKLISAQLIRERLDELLGADDEVRLHNVVGESYQKWFIARRDDLTNKLKKIEHEN